MSIKNFQPTSVDANGLTTLIRNLGRDCSPTQYLREYTKNAIEACQRTKKANRKIVIDYNYQVYEKYEIHKICFIDNGDGMTAKQMVNLLNNLSASGSVKNQHQNYGVGAKISALTRNHAGIRYESWKNNEGHMVSICYNEEEDVYGIQGYPDEYGQTLYSQKLKQSTKPDFIDEHGTKVTLFGMSEQQDTMMPPESVGGIRESWIVLYLNSRFFTLPDNIQIKARIGYYRENNPQHNYLSQIKGQKNALDTTAEEKGQIELRDATIYWWLMPEVIDGHGRTFLKGHTALLNQGEIFNISDSRSNRVSHFGIIFGRKRVIIYVEPHHAEQNTARTGLVKPDGTELTWDNWQDEFRANMPAALRKLEDTLIEKNSKESHSASIIERLKPLKHLYRMKRYRAVNGGEYLANPDSETLYNTGHLSDGKIRVNINSIKSHGKGITSGFLTTTALSELIDCEEKSVRAEVIEPDPFPKLDWASEKDVDELKDRAAEYHEHENLIVANKDFQGLTDLVNYFGKSYIDIPEYLEVIRDVVFEAYEQALVECVAGALSLKNRPHWNPKSFETAISREALTTATMSRYWMVSYIKRVLGSRIKGFNDVLNKHAALEIN